MYLFVCARIVLMGWEEGWVKPPQSLLPLLLFPQNDLRPSPRLPNPPAAHPGLVQSRDLLPAQRQG
jgi:hypothetical protein